VQTNGSRGRLDDLIRALGPQAAGVDGINVINWVIPGTFEEFAELVMPELRRRGLAQSEYAEGPLRRKLFGRDRLPDSHPAAAYRGAFADAPRPVVN
jgi:hypothetical protein